VITPLQAQFVIRRLWLAIINMQTKFEISSLSLTPSFVFAVSVTQAVLEIPKRRKLLLVSSKNWVTTGCLQFSACWERPIRLNSVVEILKMFRTPRLTKNWAIFRSISIFYERSERPTRSERTYDPTQLNSTASWVELSWVESDRSLWIPLNTRV